MAPPPTPPEEISKLMQFIAEKGKNVKSPMNVIELCRQFIAESGSSMSIETVKSRIILYRLKIHEMNEFDMETKVKMIYALSAPIDAGFLSELKKVADVEVDDEQRIIRYIRKNGGLELSGKHSRVPRKMGEQRNRGMIQFLAEKSKSTDKPIPDEVLLREFKEKTGYTDSIGSLKQRYQRVKKTIYQSTGVDRNTKIKMMFISNTKLSDEILKELREDAHVEVDEEGKITEYKSTDGSLELEGNHGLSTIKKYFYSDRWQTICEKVNDVVSDKDDEEGANSQKDKEKTRIDLVRFLIERTKYATSPMSIKQLAEDYKKKFKSSEPLGTTESRIKRFRERIHELNQFNKPTKVKMWFALSAPIDANLLKELQNDAIVELDESQRIKKYKANDGSIELEGDHSGWLKRRSITRNTKMSVVNDPSKSEEKDENEEDSSESDESDEEEALTLSARESDQLQKSRISRQHKNKKRQLPELDSDSVQTPNSPATSAKRKKARISYSSSEASEEGDDEESEKSEDDSSMNNEDNNVENGGEDFDFDPPSYHQYDERNYEDEMESIPAEKPENLLENTQEIQQEVLPEEPSTSVRDLLVLFRGAVMSVESPTLNSLLKKIELKIEQMGNGNQQIPLENIGILLKLCLVILTDLAPPECPPEEESTSLRDFLIALKVATCHINHQSIDSFHRDIKKIIIELAVQDKKIQVEIVQKAMEVAIDIISQ